MSACEQEVCRNWAGDAGCPCAVLGLEPDIVETEAERLAREQYEWDSYEAAKDAHRQTWYGPGGPGEFS